MLFSADTHRMTITATAQYDVDVTGTTKTFSYDANGNMTGDWT